MKVLPDQAFCIQTEEIVRVLHDSVYILVNLLTAPSAAIYDTIFKRNATGKSPVWSCR